MPTTARKRHNIPAYVLRSKAAYEEKLKKYGATRDAMNRAEELGRDFLQDFCRANDYLVKESGIPYTRYYEDLAKGGIFIGDNFFYKLRCGELYTCSLYQLILISGYWGKTFEEMGAIGRRLKSEGWTKAA